MKSKSFMLMILSMGFGLIAAIGISQVMGRSAANATPVQQMGTVLVAADHLDMKTHLTEENVKLENWPLSIIPEDAVTSIEEIKDMGIKTQRLSKGMPIQKSSIAPVSQLSSLNIPDGFKVVAIKVSADDTIAGLLNAGDKVDVIGLFKRRKANENQTTTRTFLKALRVFSVGNNMNARDNRSENGLTGGGVVSVLVTERQSEEIFYVMRTGEIKLVLRGDYQETDDSVEDLADIMDWGDKEDDVAVEANEEEQPKRGLFSAFGMGGGSGQLQESSMIVWTGNTPEKVVFQHGALPQRSGSTPAAPARTEGQAEELNQDDDEDFDGSNEIDRGMDQDQYPGL